MMKRKISIGVLIAVLLVFGISWVVAAGNVVDQRGVLSGTVSGQGLVAPGTLVKEGGVLVFVDTIAGPQPAARATLDGRVKEVLVRPGDAVKAGDVLVRLESLK